MDATAWIALAALALGIIGLAWNVAQDLRDHGWLRIDALPFLRKDAAGNVRTEDIVLGLANTGSHPLTVTAISIVAKGEKQPRILRRGELEQILLAVGQRKEVFLPVSVMCGSDILRAIYATDHFGHRHRLSRRRLRQITRYHPWPLLTSQRQPEG